MHLEENARTRTEEKEEGEENKTKNTKLVP
jgi:hypothetical protein